MRYKRLSLLEIQRLADELDRAYTLANPKRDSAQRNSFLVLLKDLTRNPHQLATDELTNVIIGAAVAELETIKHSYFYRSPENSDLYRLILEKLHINADNQLNDEERLTYINNYKQYLEKFFTAQDIKKLRESNKDFVWHDKNKLMKEVGHALDQVWKRDALRFSQLIKGTPNLIALQKRMRNLQTIYQTASAGRWFHSSQRDVSIELINVIDASFAALYPEENAKKIPRLQKEECDARLGIMLTTILDIGSEYKLLSPKGGWFNKGSNLYKESAKLLNITDIEQITNQQRIDWLTAYRKHLLEMIKDQEFFGKAVQDWKRKKFPDLETELGKIISQIDAALIEQENIKNLPSRKARVVTGLTSFAAQQGIMQVTKYAMQRGAVTYAVNTIGGLVAGAVGGPIGMAVYAGTTLLMTGLGVLVGNSILSNITASLFACVLEKVGNAIGEAAIGVVSYTFDPTKEGMAKLLSQLKSEDEEVFRHWVNTLLTLPNEMVSIQDKEQIRNVLGIENGALLMSRQVQGNVKQPVYIKDDYAPSVSLRA